VAVETEEKKENGEEDGEEAVAARADGAEDVATIELAGGQQVEGSGEKADPGGTADGMEEKIFRGDAGMNDCGEQMKDQRHTEHDVSFTGVGETVNYLGMKNAVD